MPTDQQMITSGSSEHLSQPEVVTSFKDISSKLFASVSWAKFNLVPSVLPLASIFVIFMEPNRAGFAIKSIICRQTRPPVFHSILLEEISYWLGVLFLFFVFD